MKQMTLIGDSLVANLNKTLQDKTEEKKAKPK